MAWELDRIMVKGRTQAMTLYELLGYLPSGDPPVELAVFADGLATMPHKVQAAWTTRLAKFMPCLLSGFRKRP